MKKTGALFKFFIYAIKFFYFYYFDFFGFESTRFYCIYFVPQKCLQIMRKYHYRMGTSLIYF